MSEAKRTPGPWVVRREGLHGNEIVVRSTVLIEDKFDGGTYEPLIADLYRGRTGNIHDANLIATAPELLEALKGLDEAYCRAGTPLTREERTEDRKRLIAARTAIAKATGRPA